MKTKTITYILSLTLFISCRDNSTSKQITDNNAKQNWDSLYRLYTEKTTSPNYFILIYQRDSSQKGQQICVETQNLGYTLDNTNLKHRLNFNSSYQPYFIDSSDVLGKQLKIEKYNLALVDSLTKYLIPSVIDSIRNEMKNKKYDTFWHYYKKYDDYMIHAILRQNISVYRDCESGFHILYEK